MFGDRPRHYPQLIHFLLLPGFSLFGLTSMLAPLRHANRLGEQEYYRWSFISEHGGLVMTSDNLEINSHLSIADVGQCETLIVCSGEKPSHLISPRILGFIRSQAAHGADIGSQDTGAHITAAAGVLDGHRSTLHWENLPTTASAYPKIEFVQELFVIDRKRFACSGALSGLDMMLHLIKTQHGNTLATKVADTLIFTHLRQHTDSQRTSLQQRLDCRNEHLLEAVQLMERNFEEPLSIAEVARYVGVSERELERLFRHYLDCAPNSYYRQIRLDKARFLLQQTRDSVTSIAESCGFKSLSHFSRCYQKQFHISPSQER